MALTPGTRLGVYEIIAPIGEGGMGQVFRARDTKLDRDVAIKTLPEAFAHDADRLARFAREAKTLASLNHPNIAGIYGLEESGGMSALVMELVEGEDLSQRIAKAAIPIDEALPIAKQIADALEAAHEQGIIHRDLKPANVKVRSDGTVKVLDFGLAKALEPVAVTDRDVMASPTITSPAMTEMGVILGTVAYMSPEQAKGRPADKRSDVWAFGAVLFEMLTAKRAFQGEDVSDTLANVLRAQPDWKALSAATPPALRRLLRRSLEKDRYRRLSDIADARLELEEALRESQAEAPAGLGVSRRRAHIAWASAAALISVAAAAIAWAFGLQPEAAMPVRRFTITLGAGDEFSAQNRHLVALSPDGRHLVYVANQRLYLRPLNQLEATPIRGTEGSAADHARAPFFSPDGQSIGFWQAGALKKIAVTGGAAVELAKADSPGGASWAADDTILFGQSSRGIWRVSGKGGDASALIPFDPEKGDGAAHNPQMLPGGKAGPFTLRRTAAASWDDAQIVLQVLATGERRVLLEGGAMDARYIASGHLIYLRENVLFAIPFDVSRLAITGGPVSVVEGVSSVVLGGVGLGSAGTASGHFAVSNDGMLAFVPGAFGDQTRTLVWIDRTTGAEEPTEAPVRGYVYPRISPDALGARVALDVRDRQQDIWVWDFARRNLTPITNHPAADISPVWTRDGTRIIFSSGRDAPSSLYWQAADGTGSADLLLKSTAIMLPQSISSHGLLVYEQFSPSGLDIGVVSLHGERKADLVISTASNEENPDLSPDGRWLAIQTNETGQSEIWLVPFPNVSASRTLVSTTGGGTRPAWARSGRELFYMQPGRASGNMAMMAVSIQTTPSLALGTPVKLFEGRYFAGLSGRTYDVAPDGKRFLMIQDTPSAGGGPPQIVIVENWFEELKRLVPTK